MEVRIGYRPSELGVIPNDWQIASIGNLVENRFILSHLDGNHGELYPRSHEFKSYGIPYIGANDFDDGAVSFEGCKHLSVERAAMFRKGVARDGDVLFAHNATVGPVALLQTTYPFVILSTTATYFRCDPDRMSNSYLKQALQAEFFVSQYRAVMAQSTRFQVPITAQRKLLLLVPPVAEQRAIAAALADMDALLAGLVRLIAKKRDIKHAVMQQLLTGQSRLPGFSGDWTRFRFGELIQREFPRSSLVSGDGRSEGSFPLYVSGAEPKRTEVAQHQDAEALVFSDGGVFAVRHAVGTFSATDHCVVISLRKEAANMYWFAAWFALNAAAMDRYTFKGSGLRNLDKSALKSVALDVPPLDEQTAIAAILSEMDNELTGLEARLDKTRALKQGMMQELLTGRTRLV